MAHLGIFVCFWGGMLSASLLDQHSGVVGGVSSREWGAPRGIIPYMGSSDRGVQFIGLCEMIHFLGLLGLQLVHCYDGKRRFKENKSQARRRRRKKMSPLPPKLVESRKISKALGGGRARELKRSTHIYIYSSNTKYLGTFSIIFHTHTHTHTIGSLAVPIPA